MPSAKGLLKGQKDVTEEALKDCSVTEVTIRSGKEKVTAFGGKSITLYLPCLLYTSRKRFVSEMFSLPRRTVTPATKSCWTMSGVRRHGLE